MLTHLFDKSQICIFERLKSNMQILHDDSWTHWKASVPLSISDNWTFVGISYMVQTTIKSLSKTASWKVLSLWTNIIGRRRHPPPNIIVIRVTDLSSCVRISTVSPFALSQCMILTVRGTNRIIWLPIQLSSVSVKCGWAVDVCVACTTLCWMYQHSSSHLIVPLCRAGSV